jgi:hypothetical protein
MERASAGFESRNASLPLMPRQAWVVAANSARMRAKIALPVAASAIRSL